MQHTTLLKTIFTKTNSMKKFVPVFIATLLSALFLQAQTPEKALENLRDNYTPEDIYIHFDKDVYVAGETMWFKAYLQAGTRPSLYSTVINIELLNDSGKIVSKRILPVIGASAVGEFTLSLDAPQMNYTVRAFTKRMLNFGPDFFYQRRIQVINPVKATAAGKQVITPRLYFMPEGGNMIGGIPAVVAFKATNQYGEPINVEGEISDNSGQTVVSFKSEHDGMGSFVFLPQPGSSYQASYRFNDQSFKEALPVVRASGVTLFLQKEDNGRQNFIVNKEKTASPFMAPAYLLGVMSNEILFKIDLSSASKIVKGQIPVKDIPSGILQLTLFTATHQPLAERMLFINNNDFLIDGAFKIDTLSFQPKKKNVFSFTVADTIPGTYSVSVVEASKDLPADSRETIISRMMVQNDIKENIHNPLYYFEQPVTAAKQKHLDLVMMTSGWRRFNWDQAMNKRLPVLSYKDVNYISFSGKAYKDDNKTLFGKTELYAIIKTKDSASDIIMVPVDSNSNVNISGMIFNDTASIAFQSIGTKKNVTVGAVSSDISKHFSVKHLIDLSIRPLPKESPLTEMALHLYSDNKFVNERIITLENVQLENTGKINKTKIVEDRYATGLFSLNGSHVYDLITNPEKSHYRNVFEYLKVNAVGMNVSGDGLNYFVNIRNTRSMMGGAIGASLFLDGFAMDSYSLATIPFNEIALVKVYSNGFPGVEGGGAGGAIAVFTKKGNDRSSIMRGGLSSMNIEGFSPAKEFFSPDYDLDITGTVPDKRTTLYWNPYLVSNTANTTITIPFYTTIDASKGFKVILTGFNAEGKLLHVEKLVK